MSKGLEALKEYYEYGLKIGAFDEKDQEMFECCLKELKALEIIRNIGILRPYETCGGQCWLETMCDATKITKENYDLLKEVLLND